MMVIMIMMIFLLFINSYVKDFMSTQLNLILIINVIYIKGIYVVYS